LSVRDASGRAVPGATGEQWGSITLDYRLDGSH